MRKILVPFLIIILIFILSGCMGPNADTSNVWTAQIILPDGVIVTGECTEYTSYSNDYVTITIDGIQYYTSIQRVTLWK